MQKVCEACREPFETTNPRKRFHDSVCRSRAHRGAVVVDLPTRTEPLTVASGVADATLQALEAADRASTPAGAAALALAARIDANSDTGSAMASMTKELRATMTEALAGAAVEPDALDELRERRLSRAGS